MYCIALLVINAFLIHKFHVNRHRIPFTRTPFMRRILFLFLLALFSASVHAAPVQDASIEKLLTLTDAKKMHESVISDSDELIDSSIKPMLHRQNMTPEQQALMDSFLAKYKKIIKDELSWQKMLPSYIQIYRDTFTEKELKELIAFYESPTGQMYIRKTPVILDKTSMVMQQKMVSILTRMDAVLSETMKEMSKSRQ